MAAEETIVDAEGDVAPPATLLTALLAFQGQAPALERDAVNPHFKNKYVSLDAITQAITPILTACQLVWTTMPCRDETGAPALNYQLAHVPSSEKLEGTMPLLLSKSDMQGLGSSFSYARRYAISAVLGLSAEDDDGNKASKREAPAKAANGKPPELIDENAMVLLLGKAKEKNANLDLLVAAVGAENSDSLTAEQGRQMWKLLDQ